LYEVFDLCSTATVLSSGKSVADISLTDVTEDDLVFHMTGERQGKSVFIPSCSLQEKEQFVSGGSRSILQVEDFTVSPKVRNISMSVEPCEIIGIAGLQGQGQSEFLRALYGFIKPTSGIMKLSGKEILLSSTSQAIRSGIGFLPGDREKEGIFPLRPISENLFAARDGVRAPLALDSMQKCAREANEIIENLHVVASGPFASAKSLSGGNQQKIIVGRWLSMDLKLLILDDPTKGVDISSRREIHTLLKEMTKKGVGMIYSSSDNEELLEICDKILVFFDGEIIQTLNKNEMSPDALASATLGVAGIRGAEKQ
jgi:ABC-type sugar transport system ATPase subunit